MKEQPSGMLTPRRSLFQRIWPWAWTRYWVLRMFLGMPGSYLERTGWLRSLREGHPCDPSGAPLPWMNYPVIAFLRDRLAADQRLFEYGSGYSTLFYTERVASVVSVEYDRGWYDRVHAELDGRARIVYCPKDEDGDYCRTIALDDDRYDVVVIDGADRVNCFREALNRLTDRGVLLLDDAHRTNKYAEAFSMAREQGFRRLVFEGLGPSGYGAQVATAVFYRPGNCFGL